MFCVFCLFTNTGFVQCCSLGSHKVCCTLLFNLFHSVILVCVFCLANTGFVQCYSLGFRQRVLPHKLRFCAVLLPRLPSSLLHRLVFILLYSVISCFARFAPPTSGLCVFFPSAPLKFTPFWFSLFY